MQIEEQKSQISIAIVLKGYPRLSETFIAQEVLSLERAGFSVTIVSLRNTTDPHTHPVHEKIKANILYLPEYLFTVSYTHLRAHET